jgi:tetratricopeptide (TPR) repeat protein
MRALFLTLVMVLPLFAQGQSVSPDQLLDRAIVEQQKGDLTAAIRDYRSLLAVRPDNLAARVNLGAALAHTGQVEAAITQYEAALQLAPNTESVQLDLGLAYSQLGKLKEAREHYSAAHQINPQDVRVAILLGDAEARTGEAPEAVAMLLPLAQANAGNSDFEYVLGESLVWSKRLKDGAAWLEKSAAGSHSAESWMFAGSVLLNLDQFNEARRDLDNAMKINPRIPKLCTMDGIAHDKDGDAQGAAPAFREALAQDPDDFQANLYLGSIYYKNRQMPEAKKYLDKALTLKPDSTMAQYEVAMWESTSGDLQTAVTALEKLEKLTPAWLEPHVELATLYYRLHRPQDGMREREIVKKLRAERQAAGTGAPPPPPPPTTN